MVPESRPSMRDILARQPMFRGLDEAELTLLASGTREYRAKRQEVIFQRGDVPDGMHIVLMGQIKLSIPSSQGNEKVVHMAGPGATFGEAMVFLERPYPVTAMATQDSLFLMVRRQTLLDAIRESPMLSRKMLASLSMRLHELIDDMETCMLRGSMQRVVCYLSQMATNGGEEGDSYQVTLGSSKQTIASQLNLAPETFSRVLSQLADAGLITVKGRCITVLDRQGLVSYQG